MHVFYRLSDGSYKKERFQNATKINCLRNFLDNFMGFPSLDDRMLLYADNVKDATYQDVVAITDEHNLLGGAGPDIEVRRSCAGSSAASFRLVLEEALKLADDEVVYFVEDDYAHLPASRTVLLEGLERAHYVTLYNHPDKYIPASKGGNPFIGEDAAEATRVFVTASSYWMLTNSTTMTFASRVETLRKDADVWRKHTDGGYPRDMQAFLDLRVRGRVLIQPIPTKATHCDVAWAAHLNSTCVTSWEKVLAR